MPSHGSVLWWTRRGHDPAHHVKNDLPATIVISAVSWPGGRALRSQTLSVRQRDFVQAAIVSGEARWRIVLVEILPNMISLVVSQVTGLAMCPGASCHASPH
jgi:ABC-type dipeptide/oligopeptide/nickel transport system permease subunit